MLRRLASILAFAALLLLSLGAREAGAEEQVFRVKSIDNLRWTAYPDRVVLEWQADVASNVGSAFGDTRVIVWRDDSGRAFSPSDPGWVQVGTVEPERPGAQTMKWEDRNVEKGRTYVYMVKSGDVSWRWRISQPVTVPQEGSAPAGSAGGGPAGSGRAQIVDQGGMFERAIAKLIGGLVTVVQWLEKLAGVKTMDVLLFSAGDSRNVTSPEPFGDWWPKLDMWYAGLSAFSVALCFLAVLAISVKFMTAGTSPKRKAEARESAWRWLFAVLFIAGAPALIRVLFCLNAAFVDAVSQIGNGISIYHLGSVSVGSPDAPSGLIQSIRTGSVLGTALVQLLFAGLELHLNIVFIVRKWVLAAFYIFTPIMAWLWVINKNVNAAAVWLGEVLSNTFLHSAYALAFALILTFMDPEHPTNWLALLVGCLSAMAIGGVFRNSLQGLWTRLAGVDEEGIGARALGMLGLGGVAALPRLMSATVQPSAAAAPSGPVPGAPSGTSPAAPAAPAPLPPVAPASGMGAAGIPGSPMGPAPAGGAVLASFPGGAVPLPGGRSGSGPGFPQIPMSLAPSGLWTPGGVTSGSSSAAATQPQAPRVPGLVRAMDYGRVAGNVAARAAGVMANVAFAATPYYKMAGAFGGAAGSLMRGAAATAAFAGISAVRSRQAGQGFWETAAAEAGGGSPAGAAARAAGLVLTDAVSPGMTGFVAEHTRVGRLRSYVDGLRWR